MREWTSLYKENSMKYLKKLLLTGAAVLMCSMANAQLAKAPPEVTAAMLVKVAVFEMNLSDGRDISIYVMGAPEVAAELRKGIGKDVGKSKLQRVESGVNLPESRPSILYVGSASRIEEALEYTRSNKILSVTGDPNLMDRGITLGFGIGDDSKPKIVLNPQSAAQEGLEWNPAIFKIAKTVK